MVTRVGLEPVGPIEIRAGVFYYRLFKYTQHTAGFTENNWVPRLLRNALVVIVW